MERAFIAQKLKDQGKDSAHNSEEEEGTVDARDLKEENMGEGVINYNYLGTEECPVDPTMEEIEYSMIFRIARIEKLDQCLNLRVIDIWIILCWIATWIA